MNRLAPILALCLLVGSAPAQNAFTSGDFLVMPRDLARASDLEASLAEDGLKVVERDLIGGLLRVTCPVGEERSWAKAVGARPDVRFAERNGIGQGGYVPNDTFHASTWQWNNTGQSGGTVGADIEAEGAWDTINGSPNVVIAVLDTGIDTDHPEFLGRIDPDGWDYVNEDSDPEADHWHGSAVSGVMMANADNNHAIAGVDHQCKVLPMKVLNAFNGGTVMDLVQALSYVATQPDVQAVSMSLINYPLSASIDTALQACANAGQILIACAGNGGLGNADFSYPGASPLTISIGATDDNDVRASFSATGAALDFVAPGENVISVLHGTSSDATDTVSGCSFATPITAGVVGLLLALAEARNEVLTQQDVYDLLKGGAEDQVGSPGEDAAGRDDYHGWGRINARASVELLPALGPCAAGNVGVSGGVGPEAVVSIDGSTDLIVRVPTNAPFTLAVDDPTTNPGTSATPPIFILFGFIGFPEFGNEYTLPAGIGDMCFAPAGTSTDPRLFIAVDGTGAGVPAVLAATPAPWASQLAGLPFPFEVAFQGVIVDGPANTLAVTNIVILDIEVFPAPAISSVTPSTDVTPGTLVSVNATDLQAGFTVLVDGSPVAATSSATGFLFTAPAGVACDSSITVTNPDGQADSAGLNASPTLFNLITPAGRPAAGGALVAIVGTDFGAGATLTFDGLAIPIVTSGPTSFVFNSPSGTAGSTVDIVITTALGCSLTVPYTYDP